MEMTEGRLAPPPSVAAWRRALERVRVLLWRLNGLSAVAPEMYAEDLALTFRAGES